MFACERRGGAAGGRVDRKSRAAAERVGGDGRGGRGDIDLFAKALAPIVFSVFGQTTTVMPAFMNASACMLEVLEGMTKSGVDMEEAIIVVPSSKISVGAGSPPAVQV